MNCFIMKALDKQGKWYEFTMKDLPTLFSNNYFVLMNKPNSPILDYSTIRRGDKATNLYEGDVIKIENTLWYICYERGFYAINIDYEIKYLYQLGDYEFVGTSMEVDAEVPINFRNKHLFMYKDKIFRFNDIIGAVDGKLLLRAISEPIHPENIRQEFGISNEGSRVYWGDKINGHKVFLHYGRICIRKDKEYIDLVTGGKIDGCVSSSAR